MATAFVRAADARPCFSRLFRAIASLGLGFALAACGGGGGDAPAPTGPAAPATPATQAQPTSAGTPHGVSSSRSIGPEGGTLASPDGKLTLTVPPGAFAQATTVGIQPIANTAHGAKGPAYRLSPEGLNTPVPMTLTFQADAQALSGTALAALSIATQDAAGRWHAKRAQVRDAASGTVQVDTHHVSDWALIAGAQLRPNQAQVVVGAQLELTFIACPRRPDLDDPETFTLDACDEHAGNAGALDNWSVNGVVTGNATFGTVNPRPLTGDATWSTRAIFVAPDAVPAANAVAVSVRFDDATPDVAPVTLVSNLTIVPVERCRALRNSPSLNFDVSLDYRFQGGGPLGMLMLDQRGRMTGQLHSVDQNDLFGTWQGFATQGEVHLSDQHTFGDTTTVLTGDGAPAIGTGIDDNQISGVTLVVDYQNCTYSVVAQIAVLAWSGAANDPPRPHNIGAFTRGNLPIMSFYSLSGVEDMPVRLQPSAEGTYAPGGLGVGLVADGYATDLTSGRADIRWQIAP